MRKLVAWLLQVGGCHDNKGAGGTWQPCACQLLTVAYALLCHVQGRIVCGVPLHMQPHRDAAHIWRMLSQAGGGLLVFAEGPAGLHACCCWWWWYTASARLLGSRTTASLAYCFLVNIWLLHLCSQGQKSCSRAAQQQRRVRHWCILVNQRGN